MINVLILDDHAFLIEGVITSLKHFEKKIEVVGTANSSDEAIEKLISLEVDLVILDLLMPIVNGATCCKIIKEKYPDIKIIALTGELDTLLLHETWANGVDAIVQKWTGKNELMEAINEVQKGNKFFGKGLPNFFVPDMESNYGKLPHLTRREQDVLVKLAQGFQRNKIAEELFISPGGVSFHIKNIYKKFDVHTKEEFMAKAKKLRLLQ